ERYFSGQNHDFLSAAVATQEGGLLLAGTSFSGKGLDKKVDEISGIAGLGWSLSIPNSISVEMHGKNDLTAIKAKKASIKAIAEAILPKYMAHKTQSIIPGIENITEPKNPVT
uniref:hypothetical protein n=1 Tax=Chryseobacterium gossypii TaxID=3231602 RepID=UPI0035260FE2